MIMNASVTLRSWMVRRTMTAVAAMDVMDTTAPSVVRSFGERAPTLHADTVQCDCDMALETGAAQAYNEEAFRYFLEIERKRSEASSRPLLLLLVDLKTERSVDAAAANQLFSGLSACLRETDFVGWYRESKVVGAVLTQRASSHPAEMLSEISTRVLGRLAGHVPAGLLSRVQLRIYQLPARVEDERQN